MWGGGGGALIDTTKATVNHGIGLLREVATLDIAYDIMCCDIMSSYLSSQFKDKIFHIFICIVFLSLLV